MPLVFGSAEANKILAKDKALERTDKEAKSYLKHKSKGMPDHTFWEMVAEVASARNEFIDAELHYDMTAMNLPSEIDAVDVSEYWDALTRSERLSFLGRQS